MYERFQLLHPITTCSPSSRSGFLVPFLDQSSLTVTLCMQLQVIDSIILHYPLLFLVRGSLSIMEYLHRSRTHVRRPNYRKRGPTPKPRHNCGACDLTCQPTNLPLFEPRSRQMAVQRNSYYGHENRHIPDLDILGQKRGRILDAAPRSSADSYSFWTLDTP